MKKFSYILLLILLMAGQCWGAVRYVDRVGVDSNFDGECANCSTPTDTDYDPATRDCGSGTELVYDTINGAGVALADNDMILVMPGQYAGGNDDRIIASEANITIRGYDPDDRPDIDCATLQFDFMNLSGDNPTIENFVIHGGRDDGEFALLLNVLSPTVRNIEIYDWGLDDERAISGFAADLGLAVFERVYIYDHNATSADALLNLGHTTGTKLLMKNVYLDGGGDITYGTRVTGSLITQYSNCGVWNYTSNGFHHPYTGANDGYVEITDSFAIPLTPYDSSVCGLFVTDTDWDIYSVRSMLSGGMRQINWTDNTRGATLNDDTPISHADDIVDGPFFTNPGIGTGIVVFGADWDNYSSQVYMDMSDVFAEKGLAFTVYANAGWFAPIDTRPTSDITYVVNNGCEVASHGFSHTRLNGGDMVGVLDMMHIDYVEANHGGTCSLAISGTHPSLTLVATVSGDDGSANDLNIDLSQYVGAAGSDTLENLIALINNNDDYTCRIGDNGYVTAQAQATSLANVTVDITSEQTLYSDAARLRQDEIIDNNTWLEGITGVDTVSYAYAGNSYHADDTTFMKALDGTSPGERLKSVAAGTTVELDLYDFDPYLGHRESPSELDTYANETLKRMYMRDVGLDAVTYGRIIFLYFHADDFDSDSPTDGLTEEEKTRLGTYIDAITSTGAKVMSHKQAIEYLENNGWAYNEGETAWQKTKPTNNFTPRAIGSLRNAGYDVGAPLNRDAESDVGPYDVEPKRATSINVGGGGTGFHLGPCQ